MDIKQIIKEEIDSLEWAKDWSEYNTDTAEYKWVNKLIRILEPTDFNIRIKYSPNAKYTTDMSWFQTHRKESDWNPGGGYYYLVDIFKGNTFLTRLGSNSVSSVSEVSELIEKRKDGYKGDWDVARLKREAMFELAELLSTS